MKLSRKWTFGVIGSAALLTVALSSVALSPQVAQAADSALAAVGWGGNRDTDRQAALAEALGVTVEELQAAQSEAFAAELAAAVEAGDITQEEADLMLAQRNLGQYMGDRMQAAHDAAIESAVEEGIITQEQADALEEEGGIGYGHGMMGGGYGRGMMDEGHGRGMMGGGHSRGMGRGMDFGWDDDDSRGMGRGMGRGMMAPDTVTPEATATPSN